MKLSGDQESSRVLFLAVNGMHCARCADSIRESLEEIPGVSEVEVSHPREAARVRARPDVDPDAVLEAVSAAGEYEATFASEDPTESEESDDSSDESLFPLFLIVGFLAGVTLLVAYRTKDWSWEPLMRHFMAGFFLTFSFFKLLDLRGFVEAYRGYDLLARRLGFWAWIYPFIELGLGVAYLLALAPVPTNAITLVLMVVGALGVLRALLDDRSIRCACLGTALNLPMTKVTLVEDLVMAAMAATMLLRIGLSP